MCGRGVVSEPKFVCGCDRTTTILLAVHVARPCGVTTHVIILIPPLSSSDSVCADGDQQLVYYHGK